MNVVEVARCMSSLQLTLDPTCSVALASLSSPSCDSSTAGSSSQPGTKLKVTSDKNQSSLIEYLM